MMYELIDWRRQILSGTLPVDELKEIKQKATVKIDIGNALLDLDLVVRDECGSILNPDTTSSISLYRAHEAATRRIKQQMSVSKLDIQNQTSSYCYCHSLYVTVKNFVCRVGDDADLLMTLYDAKESRFISENYLVKWAKEGLAKDLDQLNSLKVFFTDLGSKDLAREKVYLVCQIIRIGSMEMKDVDHKRTSQYTKKSLEGVRRPFGVAAMDITDIISGKLESDEDRQYFIPFVQCSEREFLENVIKKVLSAKEISQREHKGQGLWVCMKLFHGDVKQVREEHPHLMSSSTAVARKMGFPEIILPGDVRNDLYLTLVQGEFSKGSKSTERNVEVTVKVCNEKGQVISDVLSIGAGCPSLNEYRSVIYYHEDKPKWMETFKVAIPIEEFYSAHLKFTFKHRSSNDAKDKSEKFFAMSFVKLMQENGTTLENNVHELLVFKVDHKKFDESDVSYLSLPSTQEELGAQVQPGGSSLGNLPKSVLATYQNGGLTLTMKDSFSISTLICSTKLTQNVHLLGLLKWWAKPEDLEKNLKALMQVDGEEVVKFLQDTLDALFNILMQNSDSDLFDNLVFETLVFIIRLISDRKYQHFRPVLDMYIQENFSATLAYSKLTVVLKSYVDKAMESTEFLLETMKAIEYIFKFIVRSRVLFAKLNEGRGKEQFELILQQLLTSITAMMTYDTDKTLTVQAACLKYIPCTITDMLLVYDAEELSYIMVSLISNIALDRLTPQKMNCVNDIIFSDLFKIPECRKILLPIINDHVCRLLEKQEKKEETDICVKILSDILTVLHKRGVEETYQDIADLMLSVLRTVIQSVIAMERDQSLVGNLVAVMLAILRQMTPAHYNQYINHFVTRTDLIDFLMEILLVFRDLVSKNVYQKDWNEMIMLQNSIILKALRYFSHTLRDYLTNPFEYQVWNNFFHCAISFLTQDALQLENFFPNKRNKIISRYKDMRRETGFEIRSMWFNLGQHKIRFVPEMVGPFLEMTLIPEIELRKATIPIFFDMMQCEFYLPRVTTLSYHDDIHIHNRGIKGNFHEFENEMITKLDMLVGGGRGDEQYKQLFFELIGGLCENHSTMNEQGIKFVKTVVRLMKRLLEYRDVISDENKENRMICILNLLEFYNEINRKEMYIRYLYKLCNQHLECENYIEAAFTLKLHAELLNWYDEPLPHILRNEEYPFCETHRELKERLYCDIINYFDKGKLWEAGLTLCKELAQQYENEMFDYNQLSDLLKQMATFYDNIMKQVRPEPEYFRVAYFGRGFPAFLQNKVFVYRGKEYERLSDFSNRLLNQFPNAQIMNKLDSPGEEISESTLQYLQINKIDPVMHEQDRFHGKLVHDQILKYYKVNEVQKFTYSRPVRRGEKDSDNEFATMWLKRTYLLTSYPLPGILCWFPVTNSEDMEISPLENAIETMETTNRRIRDMIVQHHADSALPINPLSMLLNGVVDAAVMGGIVNYEKAFFIDEYLEKNPTRRGKEGIQKLKDLIACQIPLLEAGIALHGQKAPESLQPFHDHMEEAFNNLRKHVEEKYGKRSSPTELHERIAVTMRRKKPSVSQVPSNSNRSSDVSLNSSEPSRKTLSSIRLVGCEKANWTPFSNGVPLGSASSTNKMAATLTSRAQSVWVKPGSPSPTKMHGKKNRESTTITLRRSSGASVTCPSENHSHSLWYDTTGNKTDGPVIELSEQLTPHRPLRSEADKRLSRPSSGHFRSKTPQSQIGFSTPPPCSSSLSPHLPPEEVDDKPPPLPQKQAYADYTNITDDMHMSPRKSSLFSSARLKNKPPPPLPVKAGTPPAVPRKPKRPLPDAPMSETVELPKKLQQVSDVSES
ncbi:dedicator of cytokinesis protein myoblast city isoform X3 [Tachypleus tridentatus]